MATGQALLMGKKNWPQTCLRNMGIYAIGVGLMVTSSGFNHEMNKYGMGMLLKECANMGPLADIWRNWAQLGLYSVGLMSMAASSWDYQRNKKPINDILRINTVLAAACGLINLHMLLQKKDHCLKGLWVHVVLCGLTAATCFSAINKSDDDE